MKAWNTRPIRSRRNSVSRPSLIPPSSTPSTHTVWPDGRSSAAAHCNSVDFPDPEGPHHRRERPGHAVEIHSVEGDDIPVRTPQSPHTHGREPGRLIHLCPGHAHQRTAPGPPAHDHWRASRGYAQP
ncbi:hypothetical protein GCM10017771_59630 [Streptomyces capitiformicae]|uniref:Uncharacterized protein n=1 Tax=Streptomyces capitiformicae TaxID=2014920 RepID=A0A919DEE9_9ACTN|nr:hypothetical protein GCM10017771_59630 [Streptomyces capitiformicae]